MMIEFTCLSCARTFNVLVKDLPKTDYLSCVGCGRPVPVDLLNALIKVGESLSLNSENQKNESLWHIRLKADG